MSAPPAGRGEAPAAGGAEAPLTTGVKIAYAAPMFAVGGMAIPVFVFLGKFYADVVGVSLGALALAIALARAFDALTDPLMGWISDRTRTRWGRRRPYLALGAPACGLAFFALFAPPASLGPEAAAAWLGVFFLLFFVFQTVFLLPYNALGVELTLDYHERSTLFGWREAFTLVGTLSAAAAPGVLVGVLGSPRAAWAVIGAGYALLLAGLGAFAARRLRERPGYAGRASSPLVPGVRRALRNRPFRILLTSYVVASTTAAIPGTLLPFFVAYVIRPERETLWTTVGIGAHLLAALLSVPLWVLIARRAGKRAAWRTTFLLHIGAMASAFALGTGQVLAGTALLAVAGLALGGQLLLTPSLQADVIDYDELRTGQRREAQYGALWALLPKLVAIPGAALPLAGLHALGYRPNVEQSETVVLALRVLFALVPAAFGLVALAVAWRFPVTERVHTAIRRGIRRHARGEPAVDPLTGATHAAPARHPGAAEDEAALLDHFSTGELRRAEREGAGRLRRDAWRGVVLSLLLAGTAAAAVGLRFARSAAEPGGLAVVGVVAAGLGVASAVFHAIRVRAAARVAQRFDAEALRLHRLAVTDTASGAQAPRAARRSRA